MAPFLAEYFRKLSGLDPLFPRILSPESHSKFPFSERTTLLTPYSRSLVSGPDYRVKKDASPALECSQPWNCTKNCAQMVTLQNPIPALDWLTVTRKNKK